MLQTANIGYTTEIRWFFSDTPPDAVLNWFGWDALPEAKVRRDRYLVLPACESVGVKEREGKFEIKAVCGSPVPFGFGPNVKGNAETWVKWVCESREIALFLGALQREEGGWVDVDKARKSVKFQVTDDKLFAYDPLDEHPVGVNVVGAKAEITRLRAMDIDFWTICIEVGGLMAESRGDLQRFGDRFMGGLTGRSVFPRTLELSDSFSYPGWLRRLFPLSDGG